MNYVNQVCCSPNNKYIVSCGLDKTIRIWQLSQISTKNTEHISQQDTISGNLIKTLKYNTIVWSVCYSDNGRYIISGHDGRNIYVHNAKNYDVVQKINADHEYGYGCEYVYCVNTNRQNKIAKIKSAIKIKKLK